MNKVSVKVAKESEVPEGEARVYEVGGTEVLICRVEGTLYALENVCTHDDGPLGEGYLEGCSVECPRHGARFDVRTGAVLRMPAVAPVRTFPVRVEEGGILFEVEKE